MSVCSAGFDAGRGGGGAPRFDNIMMLAIRRRDMGK